MTGDAPAPFLSPEQQAVVDYRGPCLPVIACAGSGTAESISRRIASHLADAASPESTVALTFTERAAKEPKGHISQRTAALLGSGSLVLEPLDPEFAPIVLEPTAEETVGTIVELLEVLE
jgi:superfamily I DNA/RNA helicase